MLVLYLIWWLRAIYALIETKTGLYEMLPLTEQVLLEIKLWKSSLSDYNALPIWHNPSVVRVVYSDASITGNVATQ